MARLADFVVHRRTPLLWGMSILALTLVANIPRNKLNDVFLHWFDESIQFRSDTDFILDNLTGLYTTKYSLSSSAAGDISDSAFLGDVEAFSVWMEQQYGVRHVRTLTDIVKRLNMNLHGGDPTMYRLPETRELTAQFLLLYEMSLPYGLDLNN